MHAPHRQVRAAFWVGASLLAAFRGAPAFAQSIEPRAYSPAPVGLNFVIAGVTDSEGGLSVDSSLPLEDAKISVKHALFAYARSVNFWGKSGKVDVIIPYGKLSGTAIFDGDPVARHVEGFGDPLVRVTVSLVGAPAMSPGEFRAYTPDLIVGASLQVSLPLGQYDKSRVINLGTNRMFVKPAVGLSKTSGRWTYELEAAATFYAVNKEFFGGRRKTQAPIYSGQGHLVYNLPSGIWVSLDATYFTGGKVRLDGGSSRNLQRNSRLGATVALPVTRRTSIKFNASRGVSGRTGNSFDLYGVALQYRWGAGM